ncbi:MAG: VCBS repeat-containing protein [Pyrinomonadaceae bacterium]|nr:VCBS repeat-containing protein [Phycisphaerales bacterium]
MIRSQTHLNRNMSMAIAALVLTAGTTWAQSNTCSTATVITPGAYAGTTIGATTDGAASCGQSDDAPDVWYRYNATTDCQLDINLCGSAYDTVLSVHSACPGSAGNDLACNDDTCEVGSSVSLSAFAGTSYYIRIAGWDGASGAFTLTLACSGGGGTVGDNSAFLSSSPARNTGNVDRNTSISVNFARPIDPSTITSTTFHAFGKNSGAATGTFSFSNGNQTVTLDPTDPLAAGEVVTVVLSKNIRDSANLPIGTAGYAFTFLTDALPTSANLRLNQVLNDRSPSNAQTRLYGGQACDLNNDGFADLTMVNEVSADLRVFMNRADNSGMFHPFLPPIANENEASPNDSADFNFDGRTDIVTSNTQNGSVSIFLGNGNGTFQPRQFRDAGDESHGVVTLDVDGDGDIDIVNANTSSNNLALFINNGAGSFAPATFLDGGGNGEYALGTADMNNDGILDLIVGNRNSQTISVMRCNGDATFTMLSSRPAGGLAWQMAVGDLNGDGNIDVTSANSQSNNSAILLGNGNGTLQAAVTYPAGNSCIASDLGDIDGDGDLDWTISNFSSSDCHLFLNNGAGAFTLFRIFELPQSGSCAIFADLDSDGDVDLCLVDELADVAHLYENFCPADFNNDNTVTSQDFFDFIAAFFSNNADFNNDGVTTSQDFFDFLAAFFQTC